VLTGGGLASEPTGSAFVAVAFDCFYTGTHSWSKQWHLSCFTPEHTSWSKRWDFSRSVNRAGRSCPRRPYEECTNYADVRKLQVNERRGAAGVQGVAEVKHMCKSPKNIGKNVG
jgi:hypothetical protein